MQEHPPHHFDEFERFAYCKLVRAGKGLVAAAEELGFKMSTVREARRRLPEFDEAVNDAEEEMVEFAESVLMNAVRAGEPWAVKYLLNNRAAKRWKEAGGPVVQVSAENAAVLVQGDPAERAVRLEAFKRDLEARRAALSLPEVAGPGGPGADATPPPTPEG